MKNRFKLAFVALLIATIVWGISFYLILQEYYEFVEGLSEIERIWGGLGPMVALEWHAMGYCRGYGLVVCMGTSN